MEGDKLSDYERIRLDNINRNNAFLASLGLEAVKPKMQQAAGGRGKYFLAAGTGQLTANIFGDMTLTLTPPLKTRLKSSSRRRTTSWLERRRGREN